MNTPTFKAGIAALLVSVTVSSPALSQGQEAPPAIVEIAEATSGVMAPSLQTPGTVVSLNDSEIAAEISGRLIWVAPEGTYLEEGDVLARIEDRDMTIAVNRLKTTIVRLEAREKFLVAELERVKKLVAQGNAAESRAQQGESDLVTAQQDVVDAKLQLEQAELNLLRTQVRAPFPGRVVERFAQAGEFAAPGSQIARLVDTQNLEVQAQAPVRLSSFIGDGSSVEVMADGERYSSDIRAIVPVGDDLSRTMAIRVNLPDGHNLVVGSAVTVGLPSAMPTDVIAVPRDALILRADGTYVFRVSEDGTAERLRVETGISRGLQVALVSGGITPGDRVIIRGGERLRPGQSVDFGKEQSGR